MPLPLLAPGDVGEWAIRHAGVQQQLQQQPLVSVCGVVEAATVPTQCVLTRRYSCSYCDSTLDVEDGMRGSPCCSMRSSMRMVGDQGEEDLSGRCAGPTKARMHRVSACCQPGKHDLANPSLGLGVRAQEISLYYEDPHAGWAQHGGPT